MKQTTIPSRSEVLESNKWNLESLYKTDSEWNKALDFFSTMAGRLNNFQSALADSKNCSSVTLADCLDLYSEAQLLAEKIGNYAFLKKSGDESDAANLDRVGRYMMAASAFEASVSWLIPSIQAIDEKKLLSWISKPQDGSTENDRFENYRIWLEKLIRMKPYILSEKEERILALQIEPSQTPRNAFSILTNVDLTFGTIKTDEGEKPLSQTTWSQFLENPNREIRKQAYSQFYSVFDSHKNTIAALYTGSVNQDVSQARIRGYSSSRAMELFPDRVSETVYDNLVSTVKAHLDPLHRYYKLRKKVLKLDTLRHYDVYVPLVGEVKRKTSYNEAVSLITEALSPLGEEYTKTLKNGLLNGWVDRYENKGKRSGAFSSGGYEGEPYILMNYKDEVLRDVFTLAHEGGHSMHSYYSAKNNPFMSYNYTIFEAEVASTFNEDLLFRHLMKTAENDTMKAFLLSNRASDILATLYRQTMFAEYESLTHALVEEGTPLTAELL
ncbi:MAG TPA: oligoendopeptidase F, partial [Treponemataceae bacterium]|nr:oligoendopeptidase F [Treponemataceae bacterium]